MKTKIKPTLCWVLNRFHSGGAELGLEHLIQHGFFKEFDLQILTLCEGDKDFRQRLEQHNIKVKSFRNKFKLDILTWILSPIWLAWYIARQKPGAIVLSLPQANIAGRLAIAINKFCRLYKPYVISFEHNTVLAKPIYEKLFKLLHNQIDAIFSDCEETSHVVKKKFSYCTKLKTHIVPLYACDNIASPQKNLFTKRPIKILSAGRLTVVKNHIVQLKAVKILRDQGVDAQLTIYGEGSQRGLLEAYIRKHKLENAVSLPGFVRDWASNDADIYLMTSQHEGLCITILEAMQKSMPVIAYPTGGVRDYGHDTAYFIPEHSPDLVAEQIKLIIRNPDRTYEKIVKQRDILLEKFSTENVSKSLSQTSQKILESI